MNYILKIEENNYWYGFSVYFLQSKLSLLFDNIYKLYKSDSIAFNYLILMMRKENVVQVLLSVKNVELISPELFIENFFDDFFEKHYMFKLEQNYKGSKIWMPHPLNSIVWSNFNYPEELLTKFPRISSLTSELFLHLYSVKFTRSNFVLLLLLKFTHRDNLSFDEIFNIFPKIELNKDAVAENMEIIKSYSNYDFNDAKIGTVMDDLLIESSLIRSNVGEKQFVLIYVVILKIITGVKQNEISKILTFYHDIF